MTRRLASHQVVLGIIIGAIGAFAASSLLVGTNANAQFAQKGSDSRAVYMIAKQSAMQAAIGVAGAVVDPEFYVLYDDGAIRKGRVKGF